MIVWYNQLILLFGFEYDKQIIVLLVHVYSPSEHARKKKEKAARKSTKQEEQWMEWSASKVVEVVRRNDVEDCGRLGNIVKWVLMKRSLGIAGEVEEEEFERRQNGELLNNLYSLISLV